MRPIPTVRFHSAGQNTPSGLDGMRVARVASACVLLAAGVTAAAEMPETARSRAAIGRVRPALVEQLAADGMEFGSPIFVRVLKQSRELELFVETAGAFRLFKTYEICKFSGALGPKLRTGDRQSPEGFYFVNAGRLNPASRFHLSFNLGYPNAYDRARRRTGSALMVHGNCVSIGCYAMTDARIEEIYALADAALRNGQNFFRVHVFPFRMTEANLERHRGFRWFEFWRNLKEGYDYFERSGRPPNVEVRDLRYVFSDP